MNQQVQEARHGPAPGTAPRPGTCVGLAAAGAVGAGLVHAAAAGSHAGDDALVRLFAAVAVVQVMLGLGLLLRSSTRLLVGVVLANGASVGAWVLSRTIGLGPVASLAEREPVGAQDVAATVLAGLAVLAAVAAVATPASRRTRLPAFGGWVPALVLLPVLVGVTAEHSRGPSHDHDHAGVATLVAGGGHGHASGAPTSGLAANPVFVGADTSHASNDELAVAKELIDATRSAVAAGFTGEADVLAAGYRSIGDGRRVGSFEHFVNPAYLGDGRELDPGRIESLVFERTSDGKRLVSAMYILGPGKTMADVPELAGELTTWHDHQNLCWDESTGQLAGLVVNGRCVPGGTFRATPPMLHVWLEDHECGPFAGVEAHTSPPSTAGATAALAARSGGSDCGHGH